MKKTNRITYFLTILSLFLILVSCDSLEDEVIEGIVSTNSQADNPLTEEEINELFNLTTEEAETNIFATDPVTITIAARSGSMADAIHAVKDEWEAQTGHTVLIVDLPYNYLQQKIFTDVLTGVGHYDLVHIDDPWLPALADGGHLVPLSEFDYKRDPDFMPLSLDVASWPPPSGPRLPSLSLSNPPELYALPFIGNVQLVWYRKDLIEGNPDTLPELITAVEAQTRNNPDMYGYAYRSGWGNPVVTEFNAWNWSYDGDIFDEQWNVIINQPNSVQALVDFIRFTTAVDAQGYDSTGSIINEVLEGQAMMAIVWPNYNTEIVSDEQREQIGVIPFPKQARQTSQLGNWLLGIPVTAQHKQVAFDFLVWLTSRDTMEELALLGNPPVRRSIFEDPELQETFWWYPEMEIALDNATWRPRTPEWSKIEKILGNHLVQAIQLSQDDRRYARELRDNESVNSWDEYLVLIAQESLNQATNEIDAVLRQAGYRNKGEP